MKRGIKYTNNSIIGMDVWSTYIKCLSYSTSHITIHKSMQASNEYESVKYRWACKS